MHHDLHATLYRLSSWQYQDDMGAFVCKSCPIGTYQDEVGQVGFKVCPDDEITAGVGSTSVNDCDGKCKQLNRGDLVLIDLKCQECGDGLYEEETNAYNVLWVPLKEKS